MKENTSHASIATSFSEKCLPCKHYFAQNKQKWKNQSFYQQQFTKREKTKEECKKLTFLCIVMPLSRLYTRKATK